jgi:hypothetical protein
MTLNEARFDVPMALAAMRVPPYAPDKLILSLPTYVDLVLVGLDLGRWPLRPIRRAVMRWALRRYFAAAQAED